MRTISVKHHLRMGRPVRQHLRKVRVPPGWKNVKYFKDKPYLATGEDSKGRLQYVYPKRVLERGASRKYASIERLAEKKKELIDRVVRDVKDGRVEAQAVYLMFKTGFRPGSGKDTRAEKQAFGATTLLRSQVKIKPRNKVSFDFIGKKGVRIRKEVQDPLLHKIISERKDDEHLFDTSDAEVREYFANRTRGQFQLKDLRTLKAFETADKVLETTKSKDSAEIRKEVVSAVAETLGNTESVAASSYVAPKIEELRTAKSVKVYK